MVSFILFLLCPIISPVHSHSHLHNLHLLKWFPSLILIGNRDSFIGLTMLALMVKTGHCCPSKMQMKTLLNPIIDNPHLCCIKLVTHNKLLFYFFTCMIMFLLYIWLHINRMMSHIIIKKVILNYIDNYFQLTHEQELHVKKAFSASSLLWISKYFPFENFFTGCKALRDNFP